MKTSSWTPSRLVRGTLRRGRFAAAQTYLTVRKYCTGKPVWIDHKFIKLPFHGDGDVQEVNYYLFADYYWSIESSALSQHFHEGCVAVDVGANLGLMSAILSTLAGTNGHVFSFEPSLSTYDKLVEVIAKNELTNITPYNLGCGREERSMSLLSTHSSGHASLRPSDEVKRSACRREDVRIVKLDDFLCPLLGRFDFLKIDTQGYEDEVLLGSLELLKRFKPVVYLELCTEYLASSEKAVTILRNLGYSFDREPKIRPQHELNCFALPPS